MEVVENPFSYFTEDILHKNVTNIQPTEDEILPSVKEALKNIIAREGFVSHKMIRRAILSDGSNFMGDLFEVEIKGETKDGPKEIYIFLKHVISNQVLSSLVDIKSSYLREVLLYTDLSHIFSILQDNANVPKEERLKIVKSYECISDAIMLENIAKKGFKALHKMDVMPLKFAELSIAQLAKLHGLTFVLKTKNREYFEKEIKTMKSPVIFDDLIAWKNHLKKLIEMVTNHFDRDTKRRIDYFVDNVLCVKFPKYFSRAINSVNCLCHGDLRISNTMVKESDDENTEVVMIDYQFLFYGSPVTDLIYFLYTGTDGEFRKAHMSYLKDLYHKKLTEFLQYFDIDVNDVYPKKIYEKDFMDSLDYGLMVALYLSPIIFSLGNEFPINGEDKVSGDNVKLDVRSKQRVADVIEEFTKWGILQ